MYIKTPKGQPKGYTKNSSLVLLRTQLINKFHHGQKAIFYIYSNPFQKIIHKGLFDWLICFSGVIKCSPILSFQIVQNKHKGVVLPAFFQ